MKTTHRNLLALLVVLCFGMCGKTDDNKKDNCQDEKWYSNVHSDYLSGAISGGTANLAYADFNGPSDVCTRYPAIAKWSIKSKHGEVPNLQLLGEVYWERGSGSDSTLVLLTYNQDSSRYEGQSDSLHLGAIFDNGTGKPVIGVQFTFPALVGTVNDARAYIDTMFPDMFSYFDYKSCEVCPSGDNPCATKHCLHGGTCDNGLCHCPVGYTGDSCQAHAIPTGMVITGIKVVDFPALYGGWRLWDLDDSTDADLRLSISKDDGNLSTPGSRSEFLTNQIFTDQYVAPVTFQTDFPYHIAKLDTNYVIELWDEDPPSAYEDLGGIVFNPRYVNASFPDTLDIQSIPSYPHYRFFVYWEY